MACRRAGSPWWGTGDSRASGSSERTCRVSLAQVETGNRAVSTWLRLRSSRQRGVSGSGREAVSRGAGGVCSTAETKKPRLGRACK